MKLLILDAIDPLAVRCLNRHHDLVTATDVRDPARLNDLIRDREVVILRSGVQLNAQLMSGAEQLKLVIRAGCGFDNIDVQYLRDHGVVLERIPEPAAQAVAEMAFGLMLTLARRIVEADQLLRNGHWAKNRLWGYLLSGKVLGIVGAGNIGSRVGQMGAAWGMDVCGCVAQASPQIAAQLSSRGIRLATFDEVLTTADYLSLHVPLDDSTRNLIGPEQLGRMKPGSFLINLARGGVVDERALYRELTTGGRLRGAALDVHAQEGEGKISPLAGLPNVVLTPHIGASTVDSQRQIGQRIVEIVKRWSGTAPCAERRQVTCPV